MKNSQKIVFLIFALLMIFFVKTSNAQVYKGVNIPRTPTAGYGTDTLNVFKANNSNTNGGAGILSISANDTTLFFTDSTGLGKIYNSSSLLLLPDTIIYGATPDTLFLTNEISVQNGFTTDEYTNTSIAFNDGSRTFSITSSSYPFSFYQFGKKYETAAQDDIIIADTEGLWAIYYDWGILKSNHTPSHSEIEDLIVNRCIVALLYWDAANNKSLLYDERHGTVMSPFTHRYNHEIIGFAYAGEGLGLANFVISNGSDNEDAQYSIASGECYDEDLPFDINAVNATTGVGLYYRDGTDWRWTSQANFKCLTFDGTSATRLAYDNGGVLTEVADNRFVLTHTFATNIVDGNPITVIGQSQYLTLNAARDAAESEIESLVLTGLPAAEMKPIATVIFQTKDSYANDVNAKIVQTGSGDDYIDWRTTSLSAGVTSVDHGSLGGLGGDDHAQYALLAGRSGGQTLIGGTDAYNDLYLKSTSNATLGSIFLNSKTEFVGANNRLGIGTLAPTQPLHVAGDWVLTSSSTVDNEDKSCRYGGQHYDVDEEPTTMIYSFNTTSANTLNLGGGTGLGNAATTIRFSTAANNTTVTGTEALRITSAQKLATGSEVAPDVDPGGLTLRSDAATGNYLSFKDNTNIAQPFTSLAETDTYFQINKVNDATGGVGIQGFTEDLVGVGFWCYAANTNTTSSSASVAPFMISTYKSNGGTGASALAANENIWVLRNGSSAVEFVKGDGERQNDFSTAMSLFDKYDDPAMLRALQLRTSNEYKKANTARLEQLEDLGIITQDKKAGKVFVSYQKMTGLQNGAIHQLNEKLEEQQRVIEELQKQGDRKRFVINLFPRVNAPQPNDTIMIGDVIIVDGDTIEDKSVIYRLDWELVPNAEIKTVLNKVNKIAIKHLLYKKLTTEQKSWFYIRDD